MCRKSAKQTIRFWAALCGMVILLSIFAVFPVSAEEHTYYSIYPGVSGIDMPAESRFINDVWRGDYVNFGVYNGDPIKFRVLNPQESGYGRKTILLDCDTVLFSEEQFGKDSDWEKSVIRGKLNGEFLNSAFSPIEQQSISNSIRTEFPANTTSDYNYVPLTGEKIFLLDALEMQYKPYGYYAKKNQKKETGTWYLRSADPMLSTQVCCIEKEGGISYLLVTKKCGVSPALNLSLSSVLLSSAATEKVAFSSTLVSSDVSEWKLTVHDGAFFPQVTVNGNKLSNGQSFSATTGESLLLEHPGLTGDYNHVTATLTDHTGNILYYGSVDTDSTLTSSVIPVPAELLAGNYTLSVYAEKWNGAYYTDYGTAPFIFVLDVKKPCTEHRYGSEYISKSVTCMENGEKTYTCEVCGAVKTEVVPACGHNFGEWKTETAASCIEAGKEIRSCSVCGYQESKEIPSGGHVLEEETVFKATCTESGKSVIRCTVCSEQIKTAEVPALGHNWEEKWTVDEEGHWHTCTQCGLAENRVLHTGGTASETKLAECDVCGTSYGSLVPHTHSWSYTAAKPRTCLVSGNLEFWYCSSCKKFFADSSGKEELPSDTIVQLASGHKWKDSWETDGINHWHPCEYCDAVTYENIHTGGTASETEQAVCTVCGSSYGNLLEHTHVLEFTDKKLPGCIESGNSAYWYCSACGQYFSDMEEKIVIEQTIVPALGHDWSDWCYNDENHWKVCTRCAEKSEVLAHKAGVWVQDAAPSEDKAGSRHSSCPDCGYTQTAEIPVLNHVHTLTSVSAEIPDCTQNGNREYYICICGKVFSDAEAVSETTLEETVLNPLGHSFSDWIVVQQADTLEKGLEKRTCSRCQATEYRDIPAVGPAVLPAKASEDSTVGFPDTVREPVSVSKSDVASKNGWKSVGKNTAYYQDGKKMTGWNEIGGKTYFFDEKGRLQTGWAQTDGKWFYLDPNTGERVSGWRKIGNTWYYLDCDTGTMNRNSIRQIDGETYYFYDWGGMASDFWYAEETTGQWYFFRSDGAMVKSAWTLWKGKWYYSGENGVMLTDTVTPDGYRVDENGIWIS